MERKDIDMLPAGDLKSPFNPDTVHLCVCWCERVVYAFTLAVCLCVYGKLLNRNDAMKFIKSTKMYAFHRQIVLRYEFFMGQLTKIPMALWCIYMSVDIVSHRPQMIACLHSSLGLFDRGAFFRRWLRIIL